MCAKFHDGRDQRSTKATNGPHMLAPHTREVSNGAATITLNARARNLVRNQLQAVTERETIDILRSIRALLVPSECRDRSKSEMHSKSR